MSGPAKKRNRKGNVTQMHSLESILKSINENEGVYVETPQNGVGENENEDVANQEDGMGVVETYAEYWPSKLKIGLKHPDPVVCTASLASVESAEITYELKLPENVIENGLLSALQLEAVAYCSQAHEQLLQETDNASRAGFLIGDGAGVGKGRTIAGIIYENHLHGRKKAIWISVSNDLKYDAERDFHDIGAKIAVHALNKMQYNCSISSVANGRVTSGVLFCTYASLIGRTSTSGKYNTRMAQIVDWCGRDFDGCIVLDECHKAKNLIPANSLKPTKTGQAVVDLQFLLPNARVVYSSATGASEPRNMAYMVRLGIWGIGTAFRTFHEFAKAVERRGVGAMEVVAMDMKLRGMYVARQLSFQGVTFKVEKVPLTEDFIRMYDESVALWNLALVSFKQAALLMHVQPIMMKVIFGQFWGAHQRFFKYLAIAAKVDYAVKISKEAVESGKCVVIGLQSTGEARTLDELDKCDGELDDYISTAKAVFQSLVEKQFPALDRDVTDAKQKVVDEVKPIINGSRKRKLVQKFKFEVKVPISRKRKIVTKSGRRQNVKRARASNSSDDDSVVDLFDENSSESEHNDSDYDYELIKKVRSSDETNGSVDVKMEVQESSDDSDESKQGEESSDGSDEFEPDEESEPSEEEKSDSSDCSSPSEDSDVEMETRTNRNSKVSKVQEYLIKQYRESDKKGGVKDQGLKTEIIEGVREMKDDLLRKIDELSDKLPKNTLDDLINKLGGSEMVAEMTGRKGRVAGMSNGTVQYESRSELGVSLEMLNITEKERFMNGDKLIAIISEAASSGISLQSDKRVNNQRRRLHITLELPWAADQAIQQFGRTHRSNQVNAPEYMFLISELAGEQRFVATVARRLESLGALTHADRRATQTRDLSEFNIDNRYGRKALASTLHAIVKSENPMVPAPEDYDGDFFGDVHKALLDVGLDLQAVADENRKSDNIVRFLNRSLGVPVHLQNFLFKYFSDTLHATISKAKKESNFDPGLMDVGNPARIKRISAKKFFRRHATGIAPVELHTVRVDRGLTWEEALEISKTLTKEHEGFYIYKDTKANKRKAILAVRLSDDDTLPPQLMMFAVYRPNTGLSVYTESLGQIERSNYITTADQAKKHWLYQYNSSATECNHAFFNGTCKNSVISTCDVGKRITTRVVLSGSVLGVWDRVEKQLRGGEDGLGQIIRMQVCRLRTNDGRPSTVGILVPYECVDELSNELGADAERIEDIEHSDETPAIQEVKIEPKAEVKVKPTIVPKIESTIVPKIEATSVPKIEPKSEPNDAREAEQ